MEQVLNSNHRCSLLAFGQCDKCRSYLALRYGRYCIIDEQTIFMDYMKEVRASQTVANAFALSNHIEQPNAPVPKHGNILTKSVWNIAAMTSNTSVQSTDTWERSGTLSPTHPRPHSDEYAYATAAVSPVQRTAHLPKHDSVISSHVCPPCELIHLEEHECLPCTLPHLTTDEQSVCLRAHLDEHVCPTCSKEHVEETAPSSQISGRKIRSASSSRNYLFEDTDDDQSATTTISRRRRARQPEEHPTNVGLPPPSSEGLAPASHHSITRMSAHFAPPSKVELVSGSEIQDIMIDPATTTVGDAQRPPSQGGRSDHSTVLDPPRRSDNTPSPPATLRYRKHDEQLTRRRRSHRESDVARQPSPTPSVASTSTPRATQRAKPPSIMGALLGKRVPDPPKPKRSSQNVEPPAKADDSTERRHRR